MFEVDLWEYRARRRMLLRCCAKRRRHHLECKDLQTAMLNIRILTTSLRAAIPTLHCLVAVIKP